MRCFLLLSLSVLLFSCLESRTTRTGSTTTDSETDPISEPTQTPKANTTIDLSQKGSIDSTSNYTKDEVTTICKETVSRSSPTTAIALKNKVLFRLKNPGPSGTLSSYKWLVEKSTNNGYSWQQSDAQETIYGRMAYPDALTSDKNGNIYVLGETKKFGGFKGDDKYIIIRKSTNQGETWQTIMYQNVGSSYFRIGGIVVADDGTILISISKDTYSDSVWGFYRRKPFETKWDVTYFDSYCSGLSKAGNVLKDADGNIYLGGICSDQSGTYPVVLKSNNHGLSFSKLAGIQSKLSISQDSFHYMYFSHLYKDKNGLYLGLTKNSRAVVLSSPDEKNWTKEIEINSLGNTIYQTIFRSFYDFNGEYYFIAHMGSTYRLFKKINQQWQEYKTNTIASFSTGATSFLDPYGNIYYWGDLGLAQSYNWTTAHFFCNP